MTIPAAALPQGVKPSDIHITRLLPNPQTPITETDLPLANYRMEPNGLVFLQPITFTEVISGPLTTLPILLLSSTTTRAVLPNVQIVVDPATNQTMVSAPVRHFSQITTLRGLMSVSLSEPGTMGVGQSFVETVSWHRTNFGYFVMSEDDNGAPKVMTYQSDSLDRSFMCTHPGMYLITHHAAIDLPIVMEERTAPSHSASIPGSGQAGLGHATPLTCAG